MDNYLQTDVMAPERRLQAVEGPDGGSILFSVGTEDAGSPLNATVETVGERHGWATHPLSGPNRAGATAAACKTFAVGRSTDGRLHLVMALSGATGDTVFVCTNAATDAVAWCDEPEWKPLPYDDADHPRDHVVVSDIFVTEAREGTVLVVDILRDPDAQAKKVYRYYVNAEGAPGAVWQPHDLASDIEAGHYASALGRTAGQGRFPIDGLYTAGKAGARAELIYTPLWNTFDRSVPPNPRELTAPNGAVPDALTTVRRDDDATDLYVASGTSLFVFPADKQDAGAPGEQVVSHALLKKVVDLFAYASAPNEVTVWGRNASNTVFLTRRSAGVWSTPVPILEKAEQVTPFFNGGQSAETFFAHTGQNTLVKATKSPASAMWARQDIHLPPSSVKTQAIKFNSYTTTVQVSRPEGAAAAKIKVKLSSPTLTPVYINHLYYVVGPERIEVETDQGGRITVIEAVRSLTGAELTVEIDGEASASVNPMHGPLGKAIGLDSSDKLKKATVRDLHGNTHPLVPSSAPGDVLDAIAKDNQHLQNAHDLLRAHTPSDRLTPRATLPTAAIIPNAVLVDVGDFFAMVAQRIEVGLEAEFKVLKDLANDIWVVIVNIAGAAYTAVLDSLEAIAAAATWLYDKAKILIQDLIDYLKLLFDLGALARTQHVLKGSVKMMIAWQAKTIQDAKESLDTVIDQAKMAVDQWAGVDDWSKLGGQCGSPLGSTGADGAHHGSEGSFLGHHVEGNLDRSDVSHETSTASSGILGTLLDLLMKEADAFGTAIDHVSEIFEHLEDKSIIDVLKEIAAVIADLLLDSARNLLDAILDAIRHVIGAVLEFLDTPIYIPVVTDILDEFGVPRFSLLDLFCWVGAFAANALYIAATGHEPFPQPAVAPPRMAMAMGTAETDADSLDRGPVADAAGGGPVRADAASPRQPLDQMGKDIEQFFQTGDFDKLVSAKSDFDEFITPYRVEIFAIGTGSSSLLTIIGGGLTGFEAVSRPQGSLSKPVGALNVLSAGTSLAGEYAGGFSTIRNDDVKHLGWALTGIVLLFKAGFLIGADDNKRPPTSSVKIGSKMEIDTWRGVIAIVDAFVSLFALGVRGYHFYELGQLDPGYQRSLGIVYETGNCCDYLGRIAYAVAVNTSPPVQDFAAAAVIGTGMACGALYGAEAIIRLVNR
jgi:hypothetical protein